MQLLSPADVVALLETHGLRPRRSLGQHFLADPNTARRIVRLAGVEPGDRVLEIGPGVGSLTLALAEVASEVLAIEIDRSMLPVLEESLAGAENVRVVQADALTVDYGSLLGAGAGAGVASASEPHTPWRMVSNLPYNVATPLVMRILTDVQVVDDMLVMVQREVGERWVAPPGSRVYGAVSVKMAYYAQAETVGDVPPTVFVPKPKVISSLIHLRRRIVPSVDVPSTERLFALVHAGFAQRRKMLRRSLRAALGADTERVLKVAGVDPTARAEALGLSEWAALARAWS